MARIRTVKPEFFTDAKLCSISVEAHLFGAGLLCHADRLGRLKDDPEQLRILIMPTRKVDSDALLHELAAARFVIRYTVDGRNYLQIRTFMEHQNINAKERASIIPAPSQHDLENVGIVISGQAEKNLWGKERKGTEGGIVDLRSTHSAIEFFERDPVEQVFAYWRSLWNKSAGTRLDAKRKKRIVDALKAYGIERTMQALRGYTYSRHHRGENDAGTVYDDLELHLRDARRIEAGCLLAERHDSGVASGDMSPRERTEAATIAAVLRDA